MHGYPQNRCCYGNTYGVVHAVHVAFRKLKCFISQVRSHDDLLLALSADQRLWYRVGNRMVQQTDPAFPQFLYSFAFGGLPSKR